MNCRGDCSVRIERRAVRQDLAQPPPVELAQDCIDFAIRIVPVDGWRIGHALIHHVEPVMTDAPADRQKGHCPVLPTHAPHKSKFVNASSGHVQENRRGHTSVARSGSSSTSRPGSPAPSRSSGRSRTYPCASCPARVRRRPHAHVVPAVPVEVGVELHGGDARLLRRLVLDGQPLQEVELLAGGDAVDG
jgi:hypothetical protein